MQQFPCPWCGNRSESEFRYAGDAGIDRPERTVDDKAWAQYLHFRRNAKGAALRKLDPQRRLRPLDRAVPGHRHPRGDGIGADGMTRRLAQGGAIDRTKPLRFTFDGTPYEGFAGDTVASALLANGVRIVGRSFKYHRPRGIYTAGPEEPNAILDLRHGPRHDPNARATLEPLADGMALRSIHASGTAENDRLAFLDRLARFIPSAFYYKTFMWPSWTAYEHRIRALAGLGRVDPAAHAESAAHRYAEVDVCVVGAGPSGLAAALAAARQGKRVLLVEEQSDLGGSLRHRATVIDDLPGADWAARCETALQDAGVQILRRSTALGLYDHNVLTVVQKDVPTSPNGERIWLVRAGRIVVATGAIERPLLFANNDRPGVMLADAALMYLRHYAVKLGERVVVATNNEFSLRARHRLASRRQRRAAWSIPDRMRTLIPLCPPRRAAPASPCRPAPRSKRWSAPAPSRR